MEKLAKWALILGIAAAVAAIPAGGMCIGSTVPTPYYIMGGMIPLQVAALVLGILGTRSKNRSARKKAIAGIVLAGLSLLIFVPLAISSIVRSPVRAALYEVVDAAGPACTGTGVAAAAAYAPGAGIHPAVVLSADGKAHPETYWALPEEWWPAAIDDLQLVVCVGEEREVKVQSCGYTLGGTAERFRYEVDVAIFAAQGAEAITATTLLGTLPGECPDSIAGDYKAVRGGSVNRAAIRDWVQPFVAP